MDCINIYFKLKLLGIVIALAVVCGFGIWYAILYFIDKFENKK